MGCGFRMSREHRHSECGCGKSYRVPRTFALEPKDSIEDQGQPNRRVAKRLSLPRCDEAARGENNSWKDCTCFRAVNGSHEQRHKESGKKHPEEKAQSPGDWQRKDVVENVWRVEERTL